MKGTVPPFQSMPAKRKTQSAAANLAERGSTPGENAVERTGRTDSTVRAVRHGRAPKCAPEVSRRPTSTDGPPRLLHRMSHRLRCEAVDRIGGTNRTGEADPPPALPFGPALQSVWTGARSSSEEVVPRLGRRGCDANSSNDDRPGRSRHVRERFELR